MLEKHFVVAKGLGLTNAMSKEEYYGFASADVAYVHFHMMISRRSRSSQRLRRM
jgi:hypothetical protein